MDLAKWSEQEITLACKRENPNWTPNSGDFDYGCACYQSALKAFKSLLEDEHSGMSIQFTASILDRLLDGKPLTYITEDDFYQDTESIYAPEDYLKDHNLKYSIQCPRMSSLFKEETLDGIVHYCDVDRSVCIDINDEYKVPFHSSMAEKILDDILPITMPYYPTGKCYTIVTESFLVDKKHGDFDTVAYYYAIPPQPSFDMTDNKIQINKYFKEVDDGEPITEYIECEHYVPDDNDPEKLTKISETKQHTYQPTKLVEITVEEFEERKLNRVIE